MKWADICKLNDDQLLAELGVPEIAWPHNGQVFDVEMIVSGGGEYELEVELRKEGLAPEVTEVFSQTGVNAVTSDLFNMRDVPTNPGTYAARLRFISVDRVDWESGINDPDCGFEVVCCHKRGLKPSIERFVAQMFDTLVKAPARWWVRTWPYGYLCDFTWGHQGRIRLTKNGWVIIGGASPGDSTDALPLFLVSQQCQEALLAEISKKWYFAEKK